MSEETPKPELTPFEIYWNKCLASDKGYEYNIFNSEAKYFAELGFNTKANEELQERKRHDERMLTDDKYRERYEELSYKKGQRLTLVVEVVDEIATIDIQESLFGNKGKLIAGCAVQVINYNDINAKHDALIRTMEEAIRLDREG